jgi:hypothetical protein
MLPPTPQETLFRKHSENLQRVRAGLKQAERLHKDAIRRGDDAATKFMARMHQLMIGLLAEGYLRWIMTDPGGFNEKERGLLLRERSQLERWLRAVELAFRRHYAVPLHLDIDSTTAPTVAPQYAAICDMLKNDLALVVQDRNDVAHGQWKWLLNYKETSFNGPAPASYNYLQSRRRGEVVAHVAHLVNALVVSEPTFQRDYATIWGAINSARTAFDAPDYPAFVTTLRVRRRQT